MLDSSFNIVQPARVMKPPSTGLNVENIHENTYIAHQLKEAEEREKKREPH